MTQLIAAVYEKGMFKPVKKVKIKEHEKVKLIIKPENLAESIFKKKIGKLKKAVRDEIFMDDLKDISNDFKDVDLEMWEQKKEV